MPERKVQKYNRIKEVLIEQGRKQTWLAEHLDLDYKTVTRYVNNTYQPSIQMLFRIAELLQVSPKDLLNF